MMGQNGRHIEQAVPFLSHHVNAIHTVSEWAVAMGYSRAHFSVLIKQQYGQTPYEIIEHKKYQKIRQLVRENPDAKGIIIARKSGFDNVKSLYKFLKLHYDITLTTLREQVESRN